MRICENRSTCIHAPPHSNWKIQLRQSQRSLSESRSQQEEKEDQLMETTGKFKYQEKNVEKMVDKTIAKKSTRKRILRTYTDQVGLTRENPEFTRDSI